MMNEIPRINTLTPLIYSPDKTVAAPTPVADKTIKVEQDDRRRHEDRRKHKGKPLIERRVSSDRRGPRLDTKA